MAHDILFVCKHRPNRSPAQRFRFEQYTDILEKNEFNCHHAHLLDAEDDEAFYSTGRYRDKLQILLKSILQRLKEVWNSSYDVVFVQKEAFFLGTAWFERQFSQSAKLIYDFDDAVWTQPKSISGDANKTLRFLKNPGKTRSIIKCADMIFAGNNYLAEYARQFHGDVRIIPTTIDTKSYQPPEKSEKDRICIGWTGSESTIVHFEHAIPALRKLKERYGDDVYFKVIGDGTYEQPELGIRGVPWRAETEIEDLAEIDIGLMPLPDNEWTRGKCALKGLQYMALEIPTIMSPVGVNGDIVTHGENGLLAESVDDWTEQISFLVENPEERDRLGKAGRETIVDSYSVRANQDKYVEYLNELIESSE
jgi:glycosyltransferase involved in cell wall biosynthesis